MHLRPALPADEPQMAALCTRAFFNDDLFGRVIHPHRALYPSDVQLFWHEWIRHAWSTPHITLLVAVSDPPQEAEDSILGVAIWERQGDNVATSFSNDDSKLEAGFEWPPLNTTQNRALDPAMKNLLQDAEPYFKHFWSGTRSRTWYLSLCAVDPASQAQGCGRLLVTWGLERAAQEGVCASVVASEGNTEFYLKCGFGEVVGCASTVGGGENPMVRQGVRGGDVLFTK